MVITVENLVKDYDSVRVLDIETLQLNAGINVILGSNGSGKSTFISLISGLLKPSGGNVLYNGKKLDASIRNNISVLVQKPYL
ncbi:MAG TPA: ATP-binding cassette domain-containing protein, partial [Sedimentibacter sp.]|nr:ATP-binding cassette domain-containing protein [Sedimentibacter sp.]